jgi:hypothetical protein
MLRLSTLLPRLSGDGVLRVSTGPLRVCGTM